MGKRFSTGLLALSLVISGIGQTGTYVRAEEILVTSVFEGTDAAAPGEGVLSPDDGAWESGGDGLIEDLAAEEGGTEKLPPEEEGTDSPGMELPWGDQETDTAVADDTADQDVLSSEATETEDAETETEQGTEEPDTETEGLIVEETEDGLVEDEDRAAADPSVYTYKVAPLLTPFNRYFYVQTDNPDPYSFRLVDDSSIYYQAGDGRDYMEQTTARYIDVAYEDKGTGRVPGGYIFRSVDGHLDGGELKLQLKGNTGYEDSHITVSCPVVKDYIQYLIDTYTIPSAPFFENLDKVQSALDSIAIYPKSLRDVGKPDKDLPYPLLAISPYPELTLNGHIEMYDYCDDKMFANYLYPYVLDSLAFPYAIEQAAKRLEPSCVCEDGYNHYEVKVTFNGKTQKYGGAGTGSSNPMYTSYVGSKFTFGPSAPTYTLDQVKKLLLQYAERADADAKQYLDMLGWEAISKALGYKSGWIRVGTEFNGLLFKSYAFITTGRDSSDPSFIFAICAEDVWVDGRYVDECNKFVQGAKFSDYPTADIIVRDMTYTDLHGKTQTRDVTFRYQPSGYWVADAAGYGWDISKLPDELVLTSQEVAAMQVDCNSDIIPSGAVFDGTKKPGTPYTACPPHHLEKRTVDEPTCRFEGLQLVTCTECNYIEQEIDIPRLPHTYGEYKTVSEPDCDYEGFKVRYCTVCGEEDQQEIPALGHAYGEFKVVDAATCIFDGYKERTCSRCGDVDYAIVPATGNHDYRLERTIQKATTKQEGIGLYRCSMCYMSTIKAIPKVGATTKISGLKKNITIKAGSSTTLKPKLTPANSKEKITYSSSDKKVATVSAKGAVKGIIPGTAKITVKSGAAKFIVTVKVEGKVAAVTGVKGIPAKKTLKKGKTLKLKPILIPAGSSEDITYKSSNKKVAAVNKNGKVTAKKKGTAVITVTAGKAKATCKITVK